MNNRVFIFILTISLIGYIYMFSQKDFAEESVVTKIIDGDTLIVQGGETIRLLGIDTDERGRKCYSEAKTRLDELVLGKKVILEHDAEDRDRYGRLLRYMFLNGTNINALMVEEGLAVARFEGNQKYKGEITALEKEAMERRTGCKWN